MNELFSIMGTGKLLPSKRNKTGYYHALIELVCNTTNSAYSVNAVIPTALVPIMRVLLRYCNRERQVNALFICACRDVEIYSGIGSDPSGVICFTGELTYVSDIEIDGKPIDFTVLAREARLLAA